MSDHAEDLIRLLKDSATVQTLRKAVFSSPRSAKHEFLRVDVRPVEVRGKVMLQFSSQTETQQFHQNRDAAEASEEMARLAANDFRNLRLTTDSAVYEAKISRRGKCFLRKEERSAETASTKPALPPVTPHNRTRNYLIPEGVPCPFLIQTGVMTRDGAVKSSHARKFAQINRYLEFIHDVADLLPADRTIHVVDFGCGKSYLTFATHYLLSTLLKRDCRITGLDRRKDVVQTCTRIVDELQLQNIQFQVGDISGFQSSTEVDLVISLHACDTATDEALLQAIQWNSRVILAVPCCQHELNEHLSADAFPPLTSWGLTKERFASMTTDTMRGALMTAAGYQTQILEFIEMEHTPKNLLIRSVRRSDRSATETSAKAVREITELRSRLRIPALTLERGLTASGRVSIPVSDTTGGVSERSHPPS